MRIWLLKTFIAVLLLLGGRAFAQTCDITPLPICTATPTPIGPTNTPTFTPTPTNTPSASGACLWSNKFGGSTSNDVAVINRVASDVSGNIILVGRYGGTVNFTGGISLTSHSFTNDIFVAKLSSSGVLQWVQGFGSTGSDIAYGVATDSTGNIFVAGTFQGAVDFGGGALSTPSSTSMFLAKYSPTGSFMWAQAFGGATAFSMILDGSGSVVVTGYHAGTTNFGGGLIGSTTGATNAFVAKYSSTGGFLWAHSYGGTGATAMARSVGVDTGGNVVITGYFWGTIDLGRGSITSLGSNDIFVAKYFADGSPNWVKQLGSTDSDYAYGVTMDPAGNVVVTGNYKKAIDFGGGLLTPFSSDIFLAKYDPAGNYIWAKHFGGTSGFGSTGNAVVIDTAGNILLTGSINDFVDFGGGPLTAPIVSYDAFTVKFDLSGNHRWSKRAGADGSDGGTAIAVDSSNNVLAVGTFDTSVNWGCGTLSGLGSVDGYVVRFTP